MSRIDELQRLHEAATPGAWTPGDDGVARADGGRIMVDYSMEWPDEGTPEDLGYIVALHNSWPAIHRVLLAARNMATCGDMIRAAMNEGHGDLMHALHESLRALDGDKGAT